jgi:hypothetical protein
MAVEGCLFGKNQPCGLLLFSVFWPSESGCSSIEATSKQHREKGSKGGSTGGASALAGGRSGLCRCLDVEFRRDGDFSFLFGWLVASWICVGDSRWAVVCDAVTD